MSEMIVFPRLTISQAETLVAAYRAPHLNKHAEVDAHVKEDGTECVRLRIVGTDTDIQEMIARMYWAEVGIVAA